MKTLTLDYSTIHSDATALLRAYDIPLDGFAESLISNPESILGTRDQRMEHLKSVLAQHVPQGDDYYALADDAEALDKALIPWRRSMELILDIEGVSTDSVSITAVRHIGDAMVVRIQPLEDNL